MNVAEIFEKMINYSDHNLHDIAHLTKVWAYAKTIGELEQVDENTQFILEVAAIVHDIACPLCREKYGNTAGTYQEKEGMPLTYEFLEDLDDNGYATSNELIEKYASKKAKDFEEKEEIGIVFFTIMTDVFFFIFVPNMVIV